MRASNRDVGRGASTRHWIGSTAHRTDAAAPAVAPAGPGLAPAAVVAPLIRGLSPPPPERPEARGKFLFRGAEKLAIKGVTYGTFRPDPRGAEFHDRGRVARDFAAMAANGINAVRTYTVPPRWLLDTAARHGLSVLVGVPWEQHVTFLDDRRRARSIVERVAAGVRACAGHPSVLAFAIGNEIPAPLVRWHGRRRVERFIERLYGAAKEQDPEAPVTYVNFPSTEYLELPFLDLACFNVYLERRDRLEAYLARLHNVVGDVPLVLGELGLDSRRNGLDGQARALEWQVRAAYAAGCAGAFVFSWTDEWHRGGHDVDDWDFGLTDRVGRPKPALEAVGTAFAEAPVPRREQWPRVSVVVCTYNGNGTLADCFDGLGRLRYPDFEVIVVDDGSPDPAAVQRAREHGFRLIRTENRGLSCARNTGWRAATGEIVAYLDDDAWPDPDWLTFLASAFLEGPWAAVGGPNIAPPDDGLIADCVADAPGGPVHVLLSDTEAEHIAGCNMAFRREALAAIGGFDAQFKVAGDDVDACWRLQEQGGKLGFAPAAMVWHHRRGSVRAYWRQQRGYGRAEALLARKWPERYNAAGHLAWEGRLYGRGLARPATPQRRRVHHGAWGTGAFQHLYQANPGRVASLPLMPEWYLLVVLLAGITVLGALWRPLLAAAIPLVGAVGVLVLQAGLSAAAGLRGHRTGHPGLRAGRWALTTALHVLQPLARLRGRLGHGLSPWRSRCRGPRALPRPRHAALWSERWRGVGDRVAALDTELRERGAVVVRGGPYDRWDLEVPGGLLAAARVRLVLEEHGEGRQLIRARTWPRIPPLAAIAVGALGSFALVALAEGAFLLGGALAAVASVCALWTLREAAAAAGCLLAALPAAGRDEA